MAFWGSVSALCFLQSNPGALHFFGVRLEIVHQIHLLANDVDSANRSMTGNEAGLAAIAGENVENLAPCLHIGIEGNRILAVEQQVAGKHNIAIRNADN
jgi:hypothetical protein